MPASAGCSPSSSPPTVPSGGVVVAGPGRSCPIAYRYRPEDLAGPADLRCSTLYVVGGLYGNTSALDVVLDRAAAEPGPVEVVFNGDFHYLDAHPDAFAAVAAGVRAHRATLGNVEYALTVDAEQVGCGCDYPAPQDRRRLSGITVDRACVARSRRRRWCKHASPLAPPVAVWHPLQGGRAAVVPRPSPRPPPATIFAGRTITARLGSGPGAEPRCSCPESSVTARDSEAPATCTVRPVRVRACGLERGRAPGRPWSG